MGFVGSDINKDNLAAIATGNWGCGAFRGDPKLKVLIQLMAAAVANRSMVYFTFGDTGLRDDVAEMYAHLVQHDIDIGIDLIHLWVWIHIYKSSCCFILYIVCYFSTTLFNAIGISSRL